MAVVGSGCEIVSPAAPFQYRRMNIGLMAWLSSTYLLFVIDREWQRVSVLRIEKRGSMYSCARVPSTPNSS